MNDSINTLQDDAIALIEKHGLAVVVDEIYRFVEAKAVTIASVAVDSKIKELWSWAMKAMELATGNVSGADH